MRGPVVGVVSFLAFWVWGPGLPVQPAAAVGLDSLRDTVAALAHAGVEDKFTYISAAGGAFLEWLEGKELPGVAALKKA